LIAGVLQPVFSDYPEQRLRPGRKADSNFLSLHQITRTEGSRTASEPISSEKSGQKDGQEVSRL